MGVLLSLGFHGIPCTDPGGGRRGLTKKNRRLGRIKKQKAGDPASPYKRAGVAL